MQRFQNATEVRHWLADAGIPEGVRVRRTTNPFTGVTTFMVTLTDVPRNVAVATSFGSRTPVAYWSSDGGETSDRYEVLEEALKGTNAFPSP